MPEACSAEAVLDALPADSVLGRLWRSNLPGNEFIKGRLLEFVVNWNDVDSLLGTVKQLAGQTNKRRSWLQIESQLTSPATADDDSYRQPIAALFETVILGVVVRHWPHATELWPKVPGKKNRCEFRVATKGTSFWGEAKAMWKQSDRPPSPLKDGEVYYIVEHLSRKSVISQRVERLVAKVMQALRQLPANGTNVCFIQDWQLASRGFYPSRADIKQSVYCQAVKRLRAENAPVCLVGVIHGWDALDLVPVDDDLPLHRELKRAFDAHWPRRRT
jgi:hypothetical protein